MTKDEIMAQIASHLHTLNYLTEQYFAVALDGIRDRDSVTLMEMRQRKEIAARTYNALARVGIKTVGQMRHHIADNSIKGIKYFGKKCMDDCISLLDRLDNGEIKI